LWLLSVAAQTRKSDHGKKSLIICSTRLRLKVLSAREYIKYIKYDKKYLIGQINLTHKSKIRVDINKEVSKIDEKMTNFQKLIKLLNIYKAGKLA